MPKTDPKANDLAETGPRGLRSSLSPHSGDRRDIEDLRRDAWHEFGAVTVPYDDARLDDHERAFLMRLGQRLFGLRDPSHLRPRHERPFR